MPWKTRLRSPDGAPPPAPTIAPSSDPHGGAVNEQERSVAAMFEQQELLSRVRWQLTLRWMAEGLVLVAVVFTALVFPGVLPTARLLAILALLVLSNLLVMRVLLPRSRRGELPWGADALVKGQIMVDLLAYSVFLHWSGGVENPASVFYVLQVIIAGVLLSERWAFVAAGVSSFLYSAVLTAEYAGWLPHVHLTGLMDSGLYRQPLLLLLSWAVLSSALVVAAYLASTVVQHMRRRERELYESNLACEVRSEELATANRRLNEMASSRDAFLRYVTHELRAPVGAIQGYLRLLREGYIEPERVPEVALRAEQRAEELLALIGDLLDLGQVEQAQVMEGRERVDPVGSLMDAVDMLRPSAVAKRIKLDVRAQGRPPTLFCNPRHLALVWNNLISNAIKYTPPGGEVRVRLSVEGDRLVAEVSDTGIGIAPAEKQQIFQEFYRGEAARRFDPHGTGLGLAIVQRVANLYGAEVSVESEIGKGTTFRISFPLESLQPTGEPWERRHGPRPGKLPRTLV